MSKLKGEGGKWELKEKKQNNFLIKRNITCANTTVNLDFFFFSLKRKQLCGNHLCVSLLSLYYILDKLFINTQ